MSLTFEQLWLLSPAAEPHLDFAMRELGSHTNLLKIVQRLRKLISPTQTALTMELAQLRFRAREKFPRAAEMFFTTRGYEQSTSALLATYKSSQVPPGQRILDLCCGIGGDLCGFSERHEVQGVDRDPWLCELARRNASLIPSRSVAVTSGSALDVDWDGFDLIHADPDRRAERRTTDTRFIQPALNQLLDKCGQRRLLIKLAPATRWPELLKPRVHRQWLGERRECKQQLVWVNSGGRQPLGRKSATLVLADGTTASVIQTRSRTQSAPVYSDAAPGPGSYLYEPHAVVLAARLVDSLASGFGLRRVAQGIAYLSGTEAVDTPLLSSFRVIASLPAEPRSVAAELRSLGAGTMEWKKRGVDLQLYEQLGRLRTFGQRPLTGILMPQGAGSICVIAERCEKAPRPPSDPVRGD